MPLHQRPHSHTWIAAAACAVALCATSGCQSVNGQFYWPWETPKVDNARQERALQQAQQDASLGRNQAEGIAQSQHTLEERMDRIEAASRENTKTQEEVADLRREVEQLRKDREIMRKEIVDELATRINKYMAGNTSTPTPSGKSSVHATSATVQGGRNHTVEQGQTLEAIAKAYKSSVAKIQQANNLKDSRIHIGQTLFIPDPEK